MQLRDILEKPVHELTEQELETRLSLLKKLKYHEAKTDSTPQPTTNRPVKSNKEKRLADLLKGLSPEQIDKLKKLAQEAKS